MVVTGAVRFTVGLSLRKDAGGPGKGNWERGSNAKYSLNCLALCP